MTVIADTSPLNYLVLIGAVELLPTLYGSIYTAPACASELVAPGAPEEVRRWFENRPGWLAVTAPREVGDPRLTHLDVGEREAIALALQLRADLVLIDERDGRMAAEACGLTVAGTLRVLADGAAIGARQPQRSLWAVALHDVPRRSRLDGVAAEGTAQALA